MSSLVYPLEQVLDIKKKRVEEAEAVVKLKQEALKKEEEKLEEKRKERDEAKKHKEDKLQQLRDELDGGTTSDKVKQMKRYLEVVQEKLVTKQQKVDEQKEAVKAAEAEVEEAKEQLRMRRNEVEKLETHKVDWLKIARKELEIEEQKEMDEIGSIMHTIHQRMQK